MPTSDIKHFESGPQASQVVVHAGIAYVVGVVCEDDSKDEYEQAKSILARIDQLLALAGTDKTRLLRGWLFVSDARFHAGADRAWIEWMEGTATPARVSAVLGLGRPKFKVEIAVDAAAG